MLIIVKGHPRDGMHAHSCGAAIINAGEEVRYLHQHGGSEEIR